MTRARLRGSRQTSYKMGLWAEFVALCFLMMKGYWPLEWRYKTPGGEADLIMRRGQSIICVEVKFRSSRKAAYEALTVHQMSRLRDAMAYYLSAHPKWADKEMQFEAVLVMPWCAPIHVKELV